MVDVIRSEVVRRQVEAVRGLVVRLDPDTVPARLAPELWRDFDRLAPLAEAAKLLLARRVDDSGVWKSAGCRSAAEYLARVGGGSVRGARELLRASRRMPDLPRIDGALRVGELSVSRAELIADAAAVDPSREAELVDLAGRVSLVELARECGRVKAAADPDPDETYRRIHAQRRLRQRVDGEGAWCLSGRGTVDAGALVNHALDPLIDEMYDQARVEGRREHRDAYAYDAFVELVRRYLDHEDDNGEDEDGQAADAAEGADEVVTSDGIAEDPSRPASEPDAAETDAPGRYGIVPRDPSPAAPNADAGAALPPSGGPADPAGEIQLNRWQRRKLDQRRRRRSRSNPRYLALIRVDYEALVRGRVDGDELCEVAGLGPIPVRVARQLLGDAVVKLVLTKGVDVANVTHLGRSQPWPNRWRSCGRHRCVPTRPADTASCSATIGRAGR